MAPITTRRAPKAWAWSYSKLKNYEICPKRHNHVDLLRDVTEPESKQLAWGNTLHAALAKSLLENSPLPAGMTTYQPWVDRILAGPGELLVEQKFAINDAFRPVEYFDRSAWYRGIADVLKISGNVALAIDWKSGKILEDSVQLALMAQCVFSHYPHVKKIRTEFIWLKEDATTREDFSAADMIGLWKQLLPRVAAMKEAAEQASYPPTPNYLCARYCPVVACPHHGRSG